MLFLFAAFVVLWFYGYNRFYVLHYHEQVQLFRFDGLYFRAYLGQPGGLAKYLGSFLTQFYYYPAAGSIIIAGVLTTVFLLFHSACKRYGNIGWLLFIPFIPAALLMRAFVNIHFDMAYALGLLSALTGFRCYIMLSPPARYIAGLTLFTAVYFVAGGNALLLATLMIVFELFEGKHRFKYPYLLLLVAWSALLPWLAWQTLYTVPIHEAYFSLTPESYPFPTLSDKVLWLSFPLLYLFWRLIAAKTTQWNLTPWKILVPSCLLVTVTTAYSAYSVYDRREEIINRMAFEMQRDNWEPVLALGKAYPSKNRLVCYFTNIALAESGQLPYRMFQYRQVGTAGLFLDWQLNYFSLWYLGELYYRLGIIPEAEHCTFEALVSSPKEPAAQTMRRLVYTNIARRDSTSACKYLEYFEHSLAYRGWAQRQREQLSLAMANPDYKVTGIPQPVRHKDFFADYHNPDYALLALLHANPHHKMAFEYLMAYYLLQKDVKSAKWALDTFYKNFDYPELPAHYEEALIVYRTLGPADTATFRQYPIGVAATKRFEQYAQAYKATKGSKRNFEQLEKQFGNTYWYYIHFVEPATLQEKNEKNRY